MVSLGSTRRVSSGSLKHQTAETRGARVSAYVATGEYGQQLAPDNCGCTVRCVQPVSTEFGADVIPSENFAWGYKNGDPFGRAAETNTCMCEHNGESAAIHESMVLPR
jgi:hypothetical protein